MTGARSQNGLSGRCASDGTRKKTLWLSMRKALRGGRKTRRKRILAALKPYRKACPTGRKAAKGDRKGRKVGFPKFKAKDRVTPKFTYRTGCFGLVKGDPKALKLPRIGRVHCMENVAALVGDAKVLRMTISQHAGRWYASLTVERDNKPAAEPPKGGAVGIDLGVKNLATLSDGTVIENPRYLKKSERKLKKAQRELSRKTRGSNRRNKAKDKVARLHAHVANQRQDAMHKLTTRLAKQYSDISIEDLHVAGMVKNHHLAKSISDAAFGEFRRQLEYKTARSGARLHVVNRWYRSSKTCSGCGRVKAKLSLSERTYTCEGCGLVLDRDLNAAINIQVAGSAPETINAHGATVRRGSLSGCGTRVAVKCEPSVRGGRRAVRLGADSRKAVLQTN